MKPPAFRALLPFVAVALARALETALGLVLHTSLEGAQVVAAAVRALEPSVLAGQVAGWLAAGAVAWVILAWSRRRERGESLREALAGESSSFAPLLLVPATTVVAVVGLLLRSSWPYGHTLAVALTQDLAPARDALVFATLLALRAPVPRLAVPRARGVLFVSFLAYAFLTPDWARNWDNHPGNEPKYLRMAVALSHRLSLDVEPVSAAMEDLQPEPLPEAVASALGGLARESGRMLAALVQGPSAVGQGAITATRITRQTIGGKDGGVFHVLAPGPSLLMAPALRIDRALNRAYGTPGRLAVSVLVMNLLAALLVMATFQLVRDATERPGLAAALAFAFSFTPPFLFYFFQFYPEMPGALVLAVLFRVLFLRDSLSPRAALGAGLLLASLPWLHQKFLPVWGVLVATALVRSWRGRAPASILLGLALPQAATLYLTALYNFGIAGSVRPDALFLAWGPAGVTTARVGQGLLGLWLDARYGLLPYAPALALAGAGLAARGDGPLRLRRALPAALVYYLTVAAADNWAGAVCNLGRYLMPILPLVIAFVGVTLARVSSRRGAVAVALWLFAVTGLFAVALWRDPHAANDSALLLAKSRFADGTVYLAGLFIKTWAAGAPGLFVRTLVWSSIVALLSVWLVRAAAGRGGARPIKAAWVTLGLVLAAGALLERWPSSRTAPVFPNVVDLDDGRVVFAEGPVRKHDDRLEIAPGATTVLVRTGTTDQAAAPLPLLVGGTGLLKLPGRPPLVLRPEGARLDLPLDVAATVTDGKGSVETFLRQTLVLEGGAPAVLRFEAARESGEPREGPVR